jgi:hypothetical protein
MGLSGVPAEVLAQWVAGSCAAQGLPVKVTDPTVVRRVGALLGAGATGVPGRKRSGTGDPAGAAPVVLSRGRGVGSVAPGDADAVEVEAGGASRARSDGDVVDEGVHDRDLARQVECSPGAA